MHLSDTELAQLTSSPGLGHNRLNSGPTIQAAQTSSANEAHTTISSRPLPVFALGFQVIRRAAVEMEAARLSVCQAQVL